jgi:hypothetical protein
MYIDYKDNRQRYMFMMNKRMYDVSRDEERERGGGREGQSILNYKSKIYIWE